MANYQPRHPGHRVEDEDLLLGRARFVADIRLPGLLEAAFARSPHAHALIRSIDTAAAAALPGVHAVFTMADLRPHVGNDRLVVGLPSPAYRQQVDRPILAATEVVHVGEPLAVVIATDRYVAEDAAALVAVDYDVLDAVSDCRAALMSDAARVHHDAPHNLVAEFDLGYGDVDARLAGAPHVHREQFWLHRGGGHSLEGRGVVAQYDAATDHLTVWDSTQTPHTARQLLCDILQRDETQVRVVTPDLGGGFGPKLVFYPEEVVISLAALLLKRPVKWVEDRHEHFVATTQERDQYWDVEGAYDDDGRLLGLRGEIVHDHGAYTARGVNVPYGSMAALPLAYELPAYRMRVKLALTNTVPVTPVRGAGQPQGVFVMERMLDAIARERGIDRAEVRRRNLVPSEKMPYRRPMQTRGGIEVVLDSGDYPRCQQEALDRAGWATFPEKQRAARTAGRHVGIGFANYVEGTGRGPYEPVTVRIGPSGRIHVATGAVAMGQGTKTMLAEIVARELGGNVANVTVTTGDTGAIAYGFGGFNSRQAVMAGSSAHAAAIRIRERMLKVAGQLLEASIDDLEIDGDAVRVRGTDTRVSFRDVVRATHGTPGYRLPDDAAPGMETTEHVVIDAMTYANGTAVAEVEVDIETGAVAVTRVVFAHDCGHVVNPAIVDGQIVGGVVHGVGNALYEHMRFDATGQPVTTSLADYLLVTAAEAPPVELFHLCSPTSLNALGIKGVGESGVLPLPAAVASAVEDALSPFGVRVTRAPITPAEIVSLVRGARPV